MQNKLHKLATIWKRAAKEQRRGRLEAIATARLLRADLEQLRADVHVEHITRSKQSDDRRALSDLLRHLHPSR